MGVSRKSERDSVCVVGGSRVVGDKDGAAAA